MPIGKKVTNQSKRDTKEADIDARRQQVLSLRRSGFSIRAIATQLNISVGQAHKDIQDSLSALHAQTLELGASYRELELERIDRAIVALDPQVKKGDVASVNALIKLVDTRAKLLGLYAKTDVSLTHEVGESVATLWESMMKVAHDDSSPFD